MYKPARSIASNQEDIHEDLELVLLKHQKHEYLRPIAPHTKKAFEDILVWLNANDTDVIFDACCGVGESTINLAKVHPDCRVLGVDKSNLRLTKHSSYQNKLHSQNLTNYQIIQADLNDFWRLITDYIETHQPNWRVKKQYILYPNPYPKKSQLGKRWHASALFPYILKLCPNIEVRSNWRVYLNEFEWAGKYYGLDSVLTEVSEGPLTPFERKYMESGQTCFKLVVRP